MTLQVVEVADGAGTEMVHRVPSSGSGEFKLGSQVVVRESQIAVFFRDGKALDTFLPGRHTLSTANLPLVGDKITGRVFGESPFKAEVYFVNTNVFPAIKWGTKDPIAYRDGELSLVRLRAHGEMAVRVSDPMLFVTKVVGVRGIFNGKDIEGFLKAMVVSTLAQVIGQTLTSIFDLAVKYDEITTVTKARVFDEFAAYGSELVSLVVESITPPDHVQTRIDERSGIAAVGDINTYLRYRSALALGEAASHGGAASGAMETGAGLGLGLSMMKTIQEGLSPLTSPVVGNVTTPCGHSAPAGSKFCPECGTGLTSISCAECQHSIPGGAKFCPGCGAPTLPAGGAS